MQALQVLLLAASLAAPSHAQSAACAQLPDEIPADFVEREGFIPFEELSEDAARAIRHGRNYAPAPIGSGFEFDGVLIHGNDPGLPARLKRTFEEGAYASVPRGAKIKVAFDSSGREIWDYPPCASVVHLIRIRRNPRTVFELRLGRKLDDGKWAFGTYSPASFNDAEPAQVLRRNAYDGYAVAEFFARLDDAPEGAPPTSVKFSRVKLRTCQACHFQNSTADYQYSSAATSGPCGFVPTTPSVRESWAKAYLEKFLESPFSDLKE